MTTGSSDQEHLHQHSKTASVINRLSRTEGHIRAIKRMLQEGRPCPEVLIQLAAVRAAIDKVSRLVLEDHMESCLLHAVADGTPEDEWRQLKQALDSFIS